MLYLEPRHLKIVMDILKKYPYTFYAFGSRVRGTQKRLSDLDLCWIDPIPKREYFQIEEDFEESDLPYKVDLIDWNNCSEAFQNIIKKDLVCIQTQGKQITTE